MNKNKVFMECYFDKSLNDLTNDNQSVLVTFDKSKITNKTELIGALIRAKLYPAGYNLRFVNLLTKREIRENKKFIHKL